MLNQCLKICNNIVSHRTVIYCPAVPTFPNAIADTRATSAGTIVTYSCEEGFNAEGEFSFTAECMDNEQWKISKSQGCQSELKTSLKYFHLQNRKGCVLSYKPTLSLFRGCFFFSSTS